MSKSIGKLLGAGSCPININEQVIQNYLAKFNQPTANNLSTPITNNNQAPQPLAYNQMLANGMRAQNASAFVQYDLDKQIAQLHQSLPNNPTLQQQYTQMLANLLSQQINQQNSAVSAAPQPVSQPVQPVSQHNLSSSWDKVVRWGNNFANATEAGALAFANGTMFGNLDEVAGRISQLFGVDYQQARNAVLQREQHLRRQYPYTYGSMETFGAIKAPKIFNTSSLAPVSVQTRNRAYNAIADTIFASAGYANNWQDFFKYMVVNGLGNGVGHKFSKQALGRAGANITRDFINQGSNYLTDKSINWLYDKSK